MMPNYLKCKFALAILLLVSGSCQLSAQREKEIPIQPNGFYPPLTGKGEFDSNGRLVGDLLCYASNGELAMRECYSKDNSKLLKRIVFWPKSRSGKEGVEMWVNVWKPNGDEEAIYYRPNGTLYSKRKLIKNQKRASANEKVYDYEQLYFYESGEISSKARGYGDHKGNLVLHGKHEALTPSGSTYAESDFVNGKQTNKQVYKNIEHLLDDSERNKIIARTSENKYHLIPKVTWERALGISDHPNIQGQ